MTKKGEIILQQRDDKPGVRDAGKIATFGGGIEEGEDELDAVIRELKEELVIDVSRESIVKFCDYSLVPEIHGRSQKCAFFIIRDIDPEKITVMEGQGYVLVSQKDNLEKLNLSVFIRDVVRDYFSTKEAGREKIPQNMMR